MSDRFGEVCSSYLGGRRLSGASFVKRQPFFRALKSQLLGDITAQRLICTIVSFHEVLAKNSRLGPILCFDLAQIEAGFTEFNLYAPPK